MQIEITIQGQNGDHIEAKYSAEDKDLIIAFVEALVNQIAVVKSHVTS